MQGFITEFQTEEQTLCGTQQDLNSGSSTKKKDTDIITHARMQLSPPPRELAKDDTGNFME